MKKTIFGVMFMSFVLLSTGFALADPAETTDGFVCPVITNGAPQSPNALQLPSGEYTIVGPEVTVPTHATNGDGAGTPGGNHSAPGDTDYTAVWAGQ